MKLSQLANKKVAIWGMGIEGQSVRRYLEKHLPNQQVTFIDDGLSDTAYVGINAIELSTFDVIIKSSGISIYRPEITKAVKSGVQFTTAINIWYAAIQHDNIVAVTGTNGKTTTATLLTYLLESTGLSIGFGGNNGIALLDLLEEDYDMWVIELSSYQTATLSFSPHIGILLNLYPEHIQWHHSNVQYYHDKLNIFHDIRCKRIINYVDPISREMLDDQNTTYFNSVDSFHVVSDTIYYKTTPLISLDDLTLVGKHNLSNVCAVFTVLNMLDININDIVPALQMFKGLSHRLQVLGIKGGILYVDDSISTTPESAMAAIESFHNKPITILLGGQDRKQQFRGLVEYICSIPTCHAITMYETGPRIALLFNNTHESFTEVNNLEEAINVAVDITPTGGTILLSPAAPSYDAFFNYKERGTIFKTLTKL
jgi:UDP-N-acetylmuramoylalanine--D-glutamate ligase